MSRFFDPALSALEAYVPGEQPKGLNGLIKLNTNESPYPPSPKVLDALGRSDLEDLRLYADPTCSSLVGAIGEVVGVSADQVFVGNGSDDVLAFCFHGLCPNGAAFADITYGFYKVFAKMFSTPAREIPLREDFTIGLEDYAGLKETVFIANPNAPTGLYLELSQIETLLRQDPDRLVIVDEAYIDFGGQSAIALLPKYDNLLIIQTCSKSRQLAGGRLGFAIASPELIADMNKLKFSFNPFSINRMTMLTGEAAIRDVAYFEKTRREIMDTREKTTAALQELGFEVLPSMTNFIFVRSDRISGEEYYRKLREHNILVRHFAAPRTRDYARITIGTPGEMETFIRVTKEILKGR